MKMSSLYRQKFLITLSLLIPAVSAFAQGLVLTPLAGRNVEKGQWGNHSIAGLITDTLTLPFFDDFTSTSGYPSNARWTDNQVWVNNTFAVNPPNYNVATFDHLNKNGKPYSALNKGEMVYADSLTSQPIKLDFYKSGPSTVNYVPTDEIILSFFLQQRGLGDVPESEDSLILFFLTKTGKWQRVWSQTGAKLAPFELIQVPIDSFKYLHAAFQFRFVNYTKSTGNLNHWHIDYVRLEKYKNRSGGNDIVNIQDVGIVKPCYSMFRNYYSLPYSHFKTDVTGQRLSAHFVTIGNLNPASTVQTRFSFVVKDQNGLQLDSLPFSASSRNVAPGSDTTEKFSPQIQLDNFTGKYPEFSVTYKIDPQSNDITPDAYDALGDNNKIVVKHRYTPWYAYDDGSAEGGFGLDYAFLGNLPGQFAMKFNNLKDDSLRGLAIYFNRSESDVSFRNFNLRIWKSISAIGTVANKDVLLYDFPVDRPIYTDSINKFVYIFFDTVLPMPKGDFYVGWKQNQPFILNIGYDNNYRFNGQEVGNPNLFSNLLGSWEYGDYDVKGVPMIRPLFGLESDYTFNTKTAVVPQIKVYPNPAHEQLYWDSKFPARMAILYSKDGKVCKQVKEPGNSLNIEDLNPGVYVLQMFLQNGQLVSKQIIKK